MYNVLLGNKEGCTHLNSFCAEHYCRSEASAVCNPPGTDYRDVHRIDHLGKQCHGSGLTYVSATFHTFGNNCISTRSLHHDCHCNACNHRYNLYSGFLPHGNELGRIACSGCYCLDAFFDYNLCYLFGIGIHEHDIHAEGLVCQFLALTDLLSYYFWRSRCRSDYTEASCIGYGCCKIVFCNPGHTALNNWIFNSQKFCDSGFHYSTP